MVVQGTVTRKSVRGWNRFRNSRPTDVPGPTLPTYVPHTKEELGERQADDWQLQVTEDPPEGPPPVETSCP